MTCGGGVHTRASTWTVLSGASLLITVSGWSIAGSRAHVQKFGHDGDTKMAEKNKNFNSSGMLAVACHLSLLTVTDHLGKVVS